VLHLILEFKASPYYSQYGIVTACDSGNAKSPMGFADRPAFIAIIPWLANQPAHEALDRTDHQQVV